MLKIVFKFWLFFVSNEGFADLGSMQGQPFGAWRIDKIPEPGLGLIFPKPVFPVPIIFGICCGIPMLTGGHKTTPFGQNGGFMVDWNVGKVGNGELFGLFGKFGKFGNDGNVGNGWFIVYTVGNVKLGVENVIGCIWPGPDMIGSVAPGGNCMNGNGVEFSEHKLFSFSKKHNFR